MSAVRVDPLQFSQAADNFNAVATDVVGRLSSIHATLHRFARMAGDDPSGEAFAADYDQNAALILTAIDRVATQATNFDRALAASGILHATAEHGASAGTVPGASFAMRPERVEICPSPPDSALGGDGQDPPFPWNHVEDFIGMMWPNANENHLRDAAKAWDRIGDDLDDLKLQIRQADDPLRGTQSAELSHIYQATSDLALWVGDLANGARAMSDGCDEYADSVEDAHVQVFQMLGQLAIEIAASIGIGVALSFVTFGGAGVAAGGVIAVRIAAVAARITQLLLKVSATARAVAARMATVHRAILAVTTRIGAGGQAWIRVGTDITAGVAGSVIAESTRGGEADYLAALAGGFAGGVVTAGVLAGFARRADTLLANIAAGTFGGVAGSAASTGIYGKLDPTSLVLGGLMGAGGGGLGTFGRAADGISTFNAGKGGDAGASAGPDGPAVHIPDGAAPDATATDFGPSGPHSDGSAPGIDGAAPDATATDFGPSGPHPDGAATGIDGATPHGTTPHGTTPDGTTPDGVGHEAPATDGSAGHEPSAADGADGHGDDAASTDVMAPTEANPGTDPSPHAAPEDVAPTTDQPDTEAPADGPPADPAAKPDAMSSADFAKLSPEEKFALALGEKNQGAVDFTGDNAGGVKYGQNEWDTYAEGLPAGQKEAVVDYTGANYVDYNSSLRGLKPMTPEMQVKIDALDGALGGHPLPADVIVERGSGFTHLTDDPTTLVGTVIKEDGYLSTSLGDAAFKHEDAIFHFRAPAGTPGMYVGKVSQLANHERELLLGRGLQFRVDRVFKDGNGKWQIFAEILKAGS